MASRVLLDSDECGHLYVVACKAYKKATSYALEYMEEDCMGPADAEMLVAWKSLHLMRRTQDNTCSSAEVELLYKWEEELKEEGLM